MSLKCRVIIVVTVVDKEGGAHVVELNSNICRKESL